ncbi:MAG: T9SS type A sorting domain-containing protein, partial [Flavobacteriales bacterium]|nr:T9SS type A sorting domain-containing protein [Flavobacteriales bacterium]
VNVKPVYTSSDSSSICQGDSILLAGAYQSTAATYYDSLTTVDLCDSINITVLTVSSLPIVDISGLNSSYCTTDGAVTLTGIPAGGTFSGTGGSVVGNDFIPATGENNYTITYSFTDGLGCSNSFSRIVTVSVCTNVESMASSPTFSIYPNPVNDQLYVISKSDRPYSYRVYDLLGREVLREEGIISRKHVINLRELSSSLYIIELTKNKRTEVFKVVKKT